MTRPNLKDLGIEPLCPTVLGSSAFPGWYIHFQEQVAQYPEKFGQADLNEALLDATCVAVEDQLKSGIELVSDGEMARVDFNLGFYDYLSGIQPLPIQRKWGAPAHDQRGKYICVEALSAPNGLGALDEFTRLKDFTDMPKKMPLPGPFTLAGRIEGGSVYPNRQAVTEALIPIINKEIKDLSNLGCRFLQLDEPSFACHPDAPHDFVEIINRVLDGVEDMYISMHMCFGNFRARAVADRSYRPIFPYLLSAHVDQFSLEFASRELAELDLIKTIADAGKSIAVGLTDVKNLWIEPESVLIERIKKCMQYASASQLQVSSDCGFSQTARYAALGKMKNLSGAARQVRKDMNLSW